MQSKWEILRPDMTLVQKIRDHLGCHPITAKVLANRNITSPTQASDFFHASLEILPSPMDLSGMEKATSRRQTRGLLLRRREV